MLDHKTMAHLEAALHTLKEDIQNTMLAQSESRSVPCGTGLRYFTRRVETYWQLWGILDVARADMEPVQPTRPDPEPPPAQVAHWGDEVDLTDRAPREAPFGFPPARPR